MKKIYLRIYGNPVAQARPRAFRMGNFVRMYDPQKSKSWKESIRWQAAQQNAEKFEGAITLSIVFIFARPKSLAKRIVYHTKKPDADNLLKGVQDALEGICYVNDNQIHIVNLEKRYSRSNEIGESPGVIITIEGSG